MSRAHTVSLALAAFAALALSCADPVHDEEVAALKGETAGGPGPNHRPDQPCCTCHGDKGPSTHQFSVAGTVHSYIDPNTPQTSPLLANADVQITDATGDVKHASTNSGGNFYISINSWKPVFPLHVQVSAPTATGDTTTAVMGSHMGRTGSCADCHYLPAGVGSKGLIYVYADPSEVPP